MSTAPAPILQPFSNRARHTEFLRHYGGDSLSPADPQDKLLAQLAAFDWWQHEQRDQQRARGLGVLPQDMSWLGPAGAEDDEAYCRRTHVCLTALRNVQLVAESVLECTAPGLAEAAGCSLSLSALSFPF